MHGVLGPPTRSFKATVTAVKSTFYERINADPNQDSPIADAIMDRIVHNAYTISIGGSISMRVNNGPKATLARRNSRTLTEK